jgi:beta-lactamase regulating signal transducer with metallopeptidase domain
MGLAQSLRVLLVSGVVSPMLWSWGGRPLILFPLVLAARLDWPSRETLLLHELAHYARGDHWVRLLELVTFVLYWWHPVVWLARRELHAAEEDCCDAWVVAQAPDCRPVYARALLQTIDFLSEARPALPPVASGLGYFRELKQRLTRIVTGPATRGPSGWPESSWPGLP